MIDASPSADPLAGGDRRARVQAVLDRRGLRDSVSPEQASASWQQDRFVARARALFYARLMFLTLGLAVLALPVWSTKFGLNTPFALMGYFVMLLYSVANFLVISHPVAGRYTTYVTLCLDLFVMVIIIAKPGAGGGLQSPLLATQLVYTMLFAILFPKPLAIVPPLLALPITTRLDLLLDRNVTATELLTLLWYLALNFVIVYVIVYLNERETAAHREVVGLQDDLKDLAVVEERNRLSREIHDGLGASLSSLIIQSEYLLQLTQDEVLRKEISELKSTAEESIEELRRSLQMMREDFELGSAVEEYVKMVRERSKLDLVFERSGTIRSLGPDAQLGLFRVLQECLANALKHAGAQKVTVRLDASGARLALSVRDDGRGFDPRQTPRGHYGLMNLAERANKLGAELTIDSQLGTGTHITFSLPVEA